MRPAGVYRILRARGLDEGESVAIAGFVASHGRLRIHTTEEHWTIGELERVLFLAWCVREGMIEPGGLATAPIGGTMSDEGPTP